MRPGNEFIRRRAEEIVEMHVSTFDGNRISQRGALARRER